MSYPIGSQPQPTAPARRPAAVTAAAALLAAMAAAGLANAIVGLLSLQGITDRFRSAADATDANRSDVEGLVATLRIGLAVGLIISLVVAVLLVALAVGILRGSAGARIGTWVVCGLGALCGICGLALLAGQRLVSLQTDSTDADALRALTDAYPGWWLGLNGALSAGQTIGYLLVALLLAVPSASRFFRHRRPAPEPLRPVAPAAPYRPSPPDPPAQPPASPPPPSPPSQS
ncbi:MAG TPA: hypothetical protein VHN18_03370 [Micromonosporaceae bacterium]|nr:hypothetical protein [Micromonosporaceae bacterium]